MNENFYSLLAGVQHPQQFSANTGYLPPQRGYSPMELIEMERRMSAEQAMNTMNQEIPNRPAPIPVHQPNQVFKPDVLAQLGGMYNDTVNYLNEPYAPASNVPVELDYAGTPRYQQWLDRFTMSPRQIALGDSGRYPASIRNNGVFYK